MKADISPIFRDHIQTLVDARTGRVLWRDVIFFYGVPLAVAAPAVGFRWNVAGIDNILAALALMAGLLFNLLILLFDTAVRVRDAEGEFAAYRRELIRQLQANVTYTLTISLFLSAILGTVSLTGSPRAGLPWSAIIVGLLIHFVLLLGLILRRVRVTFLHELRRI